MTEEEEQKTRQNLDNGIKGLDKKMKRSDPVVEDRTDIEKQLSAGSAVLVLEATKSTRSNCRAQFCLLEEFQLGEGRKILAPFRLNLKDRIRKRTRKGSYLQRE